MNRALKIFNNSAHVLEFENSELLNSIFSHSELMPIEIAGDSPSSRYCSSDLDLFPARGAGLRMTGENTKTNPQHKRSIVALLTTSLMRSTTAARATLIRVPAVHLLDRGASTMLMATICFSPRCVRVDRVCSSAAR